jgi:hypothetical protein
MNAALDPDLVVGCFHVPPIPTASLNPGPLRAPGNSGGRLDVIMLL